MCVGGLVRWCPTSGAGSLLAQNTHGYTVYSLPPQPPEAWTANQPWFADLESVHFLLRAVVRQLITITEPKGTGICGVPVEGVIKDHLNWAANCCLEFAQQRDGWLAALARARRLPLLSGWMIMMEPLSEVTCTRYGSLVASEVP